MKSKDDHWPIMEILTAYVREHSPAKRQLNESPLEWSAVELPALGPDIQAIITVLKRRTRYYRNGEPESLDLRETNLRGANLAGAHLEGALLSAARLGTANLIGAHLEGADL